MNQRPILSPVYFSGTTDLSGTVLIDLLIPGTYSGIVPTDPTQGRYLQKVTMSSDSFVVGDRITAIKLTDTDGVIPVPLRSLLPNYPDVVQFYGADDGSLTAGIMLHDAVPITVQPFDTDSHSQIQYLPAGLHLQFQFVAGTVALGRTVRGTIFWARIVNSPF